jgi:hypothetical protein
VYQMQEDIREKSRGKPPNERRRRVRMPSRLPSGIKDRSQNWLSSRTPSVPRTLKFVARPGLTSRLPYNFFAYSAAFSGSGAGAGAASASFGSAAGATLSL